MIVKVPSTNRLLQNATGSWDQWGWAHGKARQNGTGTPKLILMKAPGLAVTAYGFLETLKVPPGEYLLQGAAGSTLGRQLIAMAKERGVKTINVVRRKEQVQELLDIG